MLKEIYLMTIVPDEENTSMCTLYFHDKEDETILPIHVPRIAAETLILAKQNLETAVPHVHDSMAKIIRFMGGTICKVYISMYRDEIYYTYLSIEKQGEVFDIHLKLTDALCVGYRCKIPIYIQDNVLTEEGIRITPDLLERSMGANQ